MNDSTLSASDRRDLRTMVRIAIGSCIGGAVLATLAALNPPDMSIDPADTPEIRARVAACVAAKPEIETAARHNGAMFDWNSVLEQRIAAVNAYDPSQCGQMLRDMRKSRHDMEQIVMYGAAIS